MVQAMRDALTDIADHPTVRAVVLRGVGGHFCAGGDFGSFQEMMATPAPAKGTDPIAIANRAFGHLLQQLQSCEVMTVAVVQGAAMGGGCGLAAACDLVLADHSAMFGTPELGLGLPPAQIAPFLQMRLGTPRSMHMLLHTQKLNAQQASQIGLVDELREDVDAALQTWTQHWQHAEPAALRATVKILRSGQHPAHRGNDRHLQGQPRLQRDVEEGQPISAAHEVRESGDQQHREQHAKRRAQNAHDGARTA
jgi:isohexenylglutaconyl-CoA hydratase